MRIDSFADLVLEVRGLSLILSLAGMKQEERIGAPTYGVASYRSQAHQTSRSLD